jgi:hypothetical protein
MAKKKKEPTADNVVEKKEDNVTKVDLSKKEVKEDDNVTKVDLTKKPETDAVPEQSTDEVPVRDESETSEKVVEEIVETTNEEPTGKENTGKVQDEKPVIEEITEEQVKEKTEEIAIEAEEAIKENLETGKPLPENIQKLVDFMEETGGDLNDYVTLNQDFSNLDNQTLLKEYYKKTKPHLSSEEIEFLMEDKFSYDEDQDEERVIKRKKLALKEQVADARQHLDGLKSKYYENLKAGSKLTGEQKKAWEFFNRYKRESAEKSTVQKRQHRTFLNKTNDLFNNSFKGFEYNIGDKKFRYNVKDKENVKNTQSDINNFIRKFLNENNEMSDANGYHKSLFTAMNPDAIANHFYEQGKADALKESIAKSKNVDMAPRQQHGVIEASGLKVKVLGDNSSDFKFKIKNNK